MGEKTAVVTGGLKGIGFAVSLGLRDLGFTTYATTRELPSGDSEVEGIIPIQMDIIKKEDVRNVYELIYEKHGSLDILVNNAGVALFQPFEEVDAGDWEKLFQTNVFGAFHTTQKAFPLMKERGGRIIQISSIATQHALPYNSIYASSKHALKGFSESLAEEWQEHDIYITNIHLGATYTDLWKDAEGFSEEDMLHVNDVRRVVSFLADTPLGVRIDEMTLTPSKRIL